MQTEIVLSAAERLKLARQRAGIDQGGMADLLGLSRTVVSFYENARTEPTLSTLVKWADATDVSLDWLCARDSLVRPEGFEPPTFWLGVSEPRCFVCGGPHDLDDCPVADDLDDALVLLLEQTESSLS